MILGGGRQNDAGCYQLAHLLLDRMGPPDSGFEDNAIAATAVVRGLTILTSNERRSTQLANPLKNLKQHEANEGATEIEIVARAIATGPTSGYGARR